MDLLPMADGTIGQLKSGLNVIFRHQLRAQCFLIHHWLPTHRENLIARPQMLLGMAVTFETPLHVHVRMLPRQRHKIDASMTCFAPDTFIYVDAVIEINEIRKTVDAIPSNRPIFSHAGAYGLQYVAVCPDLLVTIHT